MEVKKTKTVKKEVEVVVEHYFTCDKCGERIENTDENSVPYNFEFELK